MKKDEKNTYKYHLKQGRKVIHRGITDDLTRRETERRVLGTTEGWLTIGGRRTLHRPSGYHRHLPYLKHIFRHGGRP